MAVAPAEAAAKMSAMVTQAWPHLTPCPKWAACVTPWLARGLQPLLLQLQHRSATQAHLSGASSTKRAAKSQLALPAALGAVMACRLLHNLRTLTSKKLGATSGRSTLAHRGFHSALPTTTAAHTSIATLERLPFGGLER